MGATLYRDFGRTGADTALGAASAATASVTSTAAAAAAAPPALTSSRDTKGGEPDDGREREGGSVREQRGGELRRKERPGCRETQRRRDYGEAREVCLGRLPMGGRRGQKRPAVTVVAPASARISPLSSLFPPHIQPFRPPFFLPRL